MSLALQIEMTGLKLRISRHSFAVLALLSSVLLVSPPAFAQ